VRIGDLVRARYAPHDNGIILRIVNHAGEMLVQVLWDDGETSWFVMEYLEQIK